MDGTGWNAGEGTRRPSNYENFKVSKRRMTKLHRLTRFLTKSEKHLTNDMETMEQNGMQERNRIEAASSELRKFQSLKATNDKIASFPDEIVIWKKIWRRTWKRWMEQDGMQGRGRGIGSKPVKWWSLRREGARSRGKSCRKNRNYPTRVYLCTNDDGWISARGRDPLIMGVTDAKNAGRPWTSSRHVPWQRSRRSGMVRVASCDR